MDAFTQAILSGSALSVTAALIFGAYKLITTVKCHSKCCGSDLTLGSPSSRERNRSRTAIDIHVDATPAPRASQTPIPNLQIPTVTIV